MQIYLAVTPDREREAAAHCRDLCHAAYRVGPGSTLLRQNLLLESRGGLLSVGDREAPPIEDPEALCGAVLRECGRRGYGGAVLDFVEPPRRDRLVFAEKLDRVLAAAKKSLYLPEHYAPAAKNGTVLVCTALSGGEFQERLQEAAGKSPRLALDIQRLRMDFRLPAPTGEGTPLTAGELASLMEEKSPAVFFSPDLCARYFTYAVGGEAHFVLFDDAGTLQRKLRSGEALGAAAAFFTWPEVADIAPALFRR